MTDPGSDQHQQDLYDTVATDSADLVIRAYSSSFGLASRLFSPAVRVHVRNVYALVRVADEIVDNPDPRLERHSRELMLNRLHEDTLHALETGYSPNPIVHAFALTARPSGIGPELIDPFFASMRTDLDATVHSPDSIQEYIYGSAEVVGLMCLRVFLTIGSDPDRSGDYDSLVPGARRLGAAFQKINFLRDLAHDADTLHRNYFPGVTQDSFTDADRDAILDDIDADLLAADEAIVRLPASSRRAVRAAHDTFAELAARLRATPADQIRAVRVRVPNQTKLRIAATALYKERR